MFDPLLCEDPEITTGEAIQWPLLIWSSRAKDTGNLMACQKTCDFEGALNFITPFPLLDLSGWSQSLVVTVVALSETTCQARFCAQMVIVICLFGM